MLHATNCHFGVKVFLRGRRPDQLDHVSDGGHTFQTALAISGQFSSFLRSGDGALYAGTVAGKLYVRRSGATAFTSHAAPHFRCLGQRQGTSRIYACGDMGLDGFSVGTSDDGGDTFVRMMNFSDLKGPLACAPVRTNCAAHWARIQGVLGIGGSDAGSADAGTPDSGTADAGAPPPTPAGHGSHCASAGAGAVSLLGLGALLLRRLRS